MTLLHGDCRTVMAGMEAGSVDALVTDPPAGIGFMGKAWDGAKGGRTQWVSWLASVLREAHAVLKPGGWALVWALPRTSHWTGAALEEAGFEVRDVITHLFGTGFPKSASCLKPAAEFWWLARRPGPLVPLNVDGCRIHSGPSVGGTRATTALGLLNDDGWQPKERSIDRTMAAGRWPPNVTLDEAAAELLDAQSGVLKSGDLNPYARAHTAAVDIHASAMSTHTRAGDSGGASRFLYVAKASRRERGESFLWCGRCQAVKVGTCEKSQGPSPSVPTAHSLQRGTSGPITADASNSSTSSSGRPRTAPSQQDSKSTTGTATSKITASKTSSSSARLSTSVCTQDALGLPTGDGLSPVASAVSASPSPGTTGISAQMGSHSTDAVGPVTSGKFARQGVCESCGGALEVASHPCVKSLALMRWLVRLVTPHGGTVLDPFAGSGSTLLAARAEGLSYVGIEERAEYVEIARRRLAEAEVQLPLEAAP